MKLFGREKKRVLAVEVVFDEGGKIYTYEGDFKRFQTRMKERLLVRPDLEVPFSATAIWSDGSRQNVKFQFVES